MKKKRFFLMLILLLTLATSFTVPALAVVTEEEVTAQVEAVGREAVAGNIFIWFLCAVAFLKASQKIDSFMSSLGISVGHTGGSMLAEAMIAARGIGVVKGFGAGGLRGMFGGGKAGSGGGPSKANTGSGSGGGLSGGLAGVVGRRVMGSAVRSVTTPGAGGGGPQSTGAVSHGVGSRPSADVPHHPETTAGPTAPARTSGASSPTQDGPTSQTKVSNQDVPTDNGIPAGDGLTSQVQTDEPMPTSDGSEVVPSGALGGSDQLQGTTDGAGDVPQSTPDTTPKSFGRRLFDRSLAQGGSFATRVISSVALGSIASTGSITGPTAAAALSSYLGGNGTSIGKAAPTGSAPAPSSSSSSIPNIGGASAPTPTSAPIPDVQGGDGIPAGHHSGGSSGEISAEVAAAMPTGVSIPDAGIPASQDGGAEPIGGPIIAPDPGGGSCVPTYDNVEIGGGRITGTEISASAPEGVKFAMYSAAQYMEPTEDFSKVTTKDGSVWYKQYAQDAVSRKPYKDPGDDKVKYKTDIVKRLPKAPPRKDKI